MESVEKVFMSAEEVAEAMNISKAYAYKVLTMQGRIDRKFFYDQFYGTADRKEV